MLDTEKKKKTQDDKKEGKEEEDLRFLSRGMLIPIPFCLKFSGPP